MRKLLALLMLSAWFLPCWSADSLYQLKLSHQATDLLQNRLTACLPVQGQKAGVSYDIMGAPPSNLTVGRVVIDAGPQRMVLMTYELFARAGEDFEEAARIESAKLPLKVTLEKWPLASPLRGYAFFPVTPAKNEDANLVMGLYVAQQDGTVQQLMFYVNPSAANDGKGNRELAEAIGKTIKSGTRTLNTQGGTRQLSHTSKDEAIFITVPDGYITSLRQGIDFQVYDTYKIRKFGKGPVSLGVYTGNFPSTDHENTTQESAQILGKKVDWYQKKIHDENGDALHAEALVSMGFFSNFYAHVFLRANDLDEINELKKIAATLKISKSNQQ